MGSRTEVHRFVLHEGIAEQINTALKEDGTSRLAHWRAQVIAPSDCLPHQVIAEDGTSRLAHWRAQVIAPSDW